MADHRPRNVTIRCCRTDCRRVAAAERRASEGSGKGYLTGKIDENTTFDGSNFRNTVPRFAPEARKANRTLVDLLNTIAQRKKATPAQIALAWVLALKPWIVPIPRTTKLSRLQENVAPAPIELSEEDRREIESATSDIILQGARYSEGAQRMINR